MKRPDIEDIDNNVAKPRRKLPKKCVENDLKFIKKPNALIAILDKNIAIGTSQEIVYARIWGKKIYLICEPIFAKHQWLIYHSDKIFTSFADFEKWWGKQKCNKQL